MPQSLANILPRGTDIGPLAAFLADGSVVADLTSVLRAGANPGAVDAGALSRLSAALNKYPEAAGLLTMLMQGGAGSAPQPVAPASEEPASEEPAAATEETVEEREARRNAEWKAQVDAMVRGELPTSAPLSEADSFKAEVEAMVRIGVDRRQEPVGATSVAGAAAAASAAVDATKTYSELPLEQMLNEIGLPQYLPSFLAEEVDLPTLAMVLRRQGTAALDEALEDLGVTTKGHRMRIRSALTAPPAEAGTPTPQPRIVEAAPTPDYLKYMNHPALFSEQASP